MMTSRIVGQRMPNGLRITRLSLATAAASIAATIVLWPAPALPQQVEFHHVFDNSVLDVAPKPNEQFTEAVREFHRTGQNPYARQAGSHRRWQAALRRVLPRLPHAGRLGRNGRKSD